MKSFCLFCCSLMLAYIFKFTSWFKVSVKALVFTSTLRTGKRKKKRNNLKESRKRGIWE